MTTVWDVAVVGGGPAGSAAALRAKQLDPGARVLLLGRDDFPRDKACGDGVAAHGRDELALLGLPDLIADYRPTQRLSVISRRRARLGHGRPPQPPATKYCSCRSHTSNRRTSSPHSLASSSIGRSLRHCSRTAATESVMSASEVCEHSSI
ncbi:NAD(P)/FAD-dependent oxidoreductase [Nonomuraea recticatena]|uniref:NAD(P)/FAD-dependent oxidoreductase n=1 Tax=Nonomuraea recticatena TaxID=46178 RepID=UPI0031F9FFF0